MSAEGFSWSVELPPRQARPSRARLLASSPTHGNEVIVVPVSVGRRLEKELDGDATPSSRNELLFLVKEVSRRCGRAKVEDLLSRRDYSSSELAERLRRDGYSGVLVEELVTRALECGLVNDARYGAAFARSKVACGWGRVKIERELERRGVPVSSVEGWPEEFFSEDEEREHARLLASRRRVTGKNDYEKTVRFLVGRGYGYALSSEVARDILRGED